MKITLLTIFPSSFDSFLSFPVIRRAIGGGLVEIEVVDIRKYTSGSYRAIDDSPYGGGRGLLLRTDTMMNALRAVRTPGSRTVLMGPKGRRFTQALAHEYASEEHLVLIAGHFEGVDERFRSYIDEEVSIGDYILTGGESAAAIVAEATIRLLDGALREHSAEEESFEGDLLEYPQYTHPETYEGQKVPDVLLHGNRDDIAVFREREAIIDTIRLRPDLIPGNRDFRYFSVHRDYGNEKEIIGWIGGRLPVPKIAYAGEDFLVLSHQKGRPLSETGRNRILRTVVSVLERLWKIDISGCPADEGTERTFHELRNSRLTYGQWLDIAELEKESFPEDMVFSHGNLRLDSILANGSGLTGIRNLQEAGTADRYRDLASVSDSLEKVGIRTEELERMLGFSFDRRKLDWYRRLGRITGNR